MNSSFQELLLEAGCDEAGRGPLAGPVSAAAVILPKGWSHPLLNDSKKMSERNRLLLRDVIEKEALAWAVEMVMQDEIDRINILNASFAAMERAVKRLEVTPELLLIDGNRFRTTLDIPYECIIKGDAKFATIAAASVLAKTHRDEYMRKISEDHPQYNWNRNKGYPTKEHKAAVMKYGLSPHHRVTFCSFYNQLNLFDL